MKMHNVSANRKNHFSYTLFGVLTCFHPTQQWRFMTSTYYDFISGCILTEKIENLELANTFCSDVMEVNSVIHPQLYLQQYRQ